MVNGAHRCPSRCLEQHPVPFEGAAARLTIVAHELALHGPRELALEALERLVGVDGESRHQLAQASDEVREPLLLGAQLADRGCAVTDFRLELCDRGRALVARPFESRELARLSRLERRELGFDTAGLDVERRELVELSRDLADARRARAIVIIEVDE